MIKAVLFDMDGVLVDTEWFYNRRRVAFMEEKGFHFDEIPDLSGSNEPAIWEALVPDDVELRERLRVEYKQVYSPDHPVPYAELLNEQTVELTPYYGVVCDGDTPSCIAGIMGGEKSSVSETTTDLFIEAAFWQQLAIQGRCRKLNFSTDAAYRFERGVDFGTNAQHMEYVTRLVLEICGTSETRVGPVDDQIVNLPERKPVTMRVARCLKVVGMDIPVEAMHNTFTRLGFEYTFDGEVFTVQAPSHRFDIEIEEDLIEEVARLYGYEKLPDRPPLARIAMKSPKEASRTGHALRREMAVLGYQELINFSFVPEAWEKDFADPPAQPDREPAFRHAHAARGRSRRHPEVQPQPQGRTSPRL